GKGGRDTSCAASDAAPLLTCRLSPNTGSCLRIHQLTLVVAECCSWTSDGSQTAQEPCPHAASVTHAEISASAPPPTRRGRGPSAQALPAAAHRPPASPCLSLSRAPGPASSRSAAASWVAVPRTRSAPGGGRPAAGTPAPRTSGRSCSQGKDDLASLASGVNLV